MRTCRLSTMRPAGVSQARTSLDMGALRARNVTPEQIIGYCAWLLRLQPTPIPCKPADLLADFSWEHCAPTTWTAR